MGSVGCLVLRGVYTALLYCCCTPLGFVRGRRLCYEIKVHARSQQHSQVCRTVRACTINIFISLGEMWHAVQTLLQSTGGHTAFSVAHALPK